MTETLPQLPRLNNGSSAFTIPETSEQRQDRDVECDALLRLYQSEWEKARDLQSQANGFATLLAVVMTGVLALVSQHWTELATLPLALIVIALGAFGVLMSGKQNEQFMLHIERAKGWRDQAASLIPDAAILPAKEAAWNAHKERFPHFHHLQLGEYWFRFYVVYTVIGVILFGLALI
jgi:hypothetical protein